MRRVRKPNKTVKTTRPAKGAWQKQIQANTTRLNKGSQNIRTSHRGR